MFSKSPLQFHAEQLIQILLKPQTKKVCHIQPVGVTTTASFVIDIDDVNFIDLRADDLGVWKTNGTKTTHFTILENNTIQVGRSRYGYRMTRRYYVHGTYSLFRRVIADIDIDRFLCNRFQWTAS